MTNTTIDGERARELLRQMQTIRAFETHVEALFQAGELPGFVHTCTWAGGGRGRRVRPAQPTTTSPRRTAATGTRSPRASPSTELWPSCTARRPAPAAGAAARCTSPTSRSACSARTASSAAGSASPPVRRCRRSVSADRPGGRVLLRRRRHQQGHVPRGVQLRRRCAACRSCSCARTTGSRSSRRIERTTAVTDLAVRARRVRDRRRDRRRQRRTRRARRGRGRQSAAPAAVEAPTLAQHGDVPPRRPLRRRRRGVPDARRSTTRPAPARSDHAARGAARSSAGAARRSPHATRCGTACGQEVDAADEFAESSPLPEPSDGARRTCSPVRSPG